MKKTYQNPTLKVVKIQPAQFIAGSDFGQGQKDGSQAAARGGRFSADEWDEEQAPFNPPKGRPSFSRYAFLLWQANKFER